MFGSIGGFDLRGVGAGFARTEGSPTCRSRRCSSRTHTIRRRARRPHLCSEIRSLQKRLLPPVRRPTAMQDGRGGPCQWRLAPNQDADGPSRLGRLPLVATGCRSPRLSRFCGGLLVDRLPLGAPPWLDKCSISVRGISNGNGAFGVNECAFLEGSTFCADRGRATTGHCLGEVEWSLAKAAGFAWIKPCWSVVLNRDRHGLRCARGRSRRGEPCTNSPT